MPYGGGSFLTQNKSLPGSYINYVSAARASAALSDRGIVAAPMLFDWGNDSEAFEVTAADVQKDSVKLFGYEYTAPELRDVREIFRHATKAIFYRLNAGNKAAATAAPLTATAKWSGTKGNDLQIVVVQNVDDNSKYDVTTYFGTEKIETQTVADCNELVSNDFIDFSGAGVPVETAGMLLTGGTNLADVTGTQYQAALDKFEAFGFNVLICPTDDNTTIDLFDAYTKRLRDENGIKFQLVAYRKAADYEGTISVENTVNDVGAKPGALVFWVGGLEAATAFNKSATNAKYDGEYDVNAEYTQSQLKTGLAAGKFMLHKVSGEIRVLSDVNTFVSFTSEKGKDFAKNQCIRLFDEDANAIALIFNSKYLGRSNNVAANRLGLWNDIVKLRREYETLAAIEDFDTKDVEVREGETKESVEVYAPLKPAVAMEKMYTTVYVI